MAITGSFASVAVRSEPRFYLHPGTLTHTQSGQYPGLSSAQFRNLTAGTTGEPWPQLKSPLVVSLATLFRCNLACSHCYVGSTNEDKPDTLSPEQVRTILTHLREIEVFDVVITGGEALLATDIYGSLRYAKELGLYVCLNTNGTLVTAGIAQKIRETGVDVVKISIDSADAAIHDAFRGQPRSLERSVNAIRHLVSIGVRVDTHTVVSAGSTSSTDDIDAILSLGASLGVTKCHFGRVYSTGRATDELKVVNQRLDQLGSYVAHRKAEPGSIVGRLPIGSTVNVVRMPTYDGCGNCANPAYLYLSYNGGVYPCTNLYKAEWKLGDVRSERLDDIVGRSRKLHALKQHLSDAQSMPVSAGLTVHE